MLNYSKANIDSPYSFFSVATSPTGHTTATKALLDSSANRACISLELAHKIGAKIHPAPHTSGTAADGHSIEISGWTHLWNGCDCDTHKCSKRFFWRLLVIKDLSEPMIIPFGDILEMNLMS